MAWCLSDHESSDVIEAFLNSIKARSPLTTVNVMMTDDGTVNVLYIYIKTHDSVSCGPRSRRATP